MDNQRNRTIAAIVDYCKTCGIDVHTETKARGHQGVFLHDNKNFKRIDISKKLPKEKVLQVIAHEFAHFFHQKLDKNFENLQEIFGVKHEILIPELNSITLFLVGDENEISAKKALDEIIQGIKDYEAIIKKDYPNFKRSAKFIEFERYIKRSEARFLLKYDNVKIVNLTGYVVYKLENIKQDFPEIPEPFIAYINLRALQRRQKRISRRLNKLKNYYEKPTELFARFIEAYVVDKNIVQELAPETYSSFVERLDFKVFKQLKEFLDLFENQ